MLIPLWFDTQLLSIMSKIEQRRIGDVKTVATNRKARHDYFIEETYEAGLVLTGSEIKSIRAGHVNLRDSFAVVKEGELWLMNTHIAPYDQATYANHEPRRSRKLLMHRREINRIAGKLQEKGFTLVPLRLYLKNNLAKVELGLGRGKKQYDKRAALREKETRREIDRVVARHWKER
jgi:SsrA-binding protein